MNRRQFIRTATYTGLGAAVNGGRQFVENLQNGGPIRPLPSANNNATNSSSSPAISPTIQEVNYETDQIKQQLGAAAEHSVAATVVGGGIGATVAVVHNELETAALRSVIRTARRSMIKDAVRRKLLRESLEEPGNNDITR